MLSYCSAFYYTMQRERRRETGVGCVLGFRARTRCATSARWLIRVRVWWRSRGGIKEWEKDRLRKLERTWPQQQPLLVASKALREEKQYTVEIHFINILYGSLQHVYLIIMINEKNSSRPTPWANKFWFNAPLLTVSDSVFFLIIKHMTVTWSQIEFL